MSTEQNDDGPVFKVETVSGRWAKVSAFGQEIPGVIRLTHETAFSSGDRVITTITLVLDGAQVEQVVKGDEA